jgi:hypothetical protein
MPSDFACTQHPKPPQIAEQDKHTSAQLSISALSCHRLYENLSLLPQEAAVAGAAGEGVARVANVEGSAVCLECWLRYMQNRVRLSARITASNASDEAPRRKNKIKSECLLRINTLEKSEYLLSKS